MGVNVGKSRTEDMSATRRDACDALIDNLAFMSALHFAGCYNLCLLHHNHILLPRP